MRRIFVVLALLLPGQRTPAVAGDGSVPELRDLKRGERHTYPFSADAGQLVSARLERLSGKMSVRLMGPEGRVLAQAGDILEIYSERLSRHAPHTGRYAWEVHGAGADVVRYRLTWTARDPGPHDAARLAADAQLMDGLRTTEDPDFDPIDRRLARLEQAAASFHEAGDAVGEAEARLYVGSMMAMYGRSREALATLEPALDLWKAAGDTRGEALTHVQLGAAHEELGDPERAIALYEQARPVVRALGAATDECTLLNQLGGALGRIGEAQKALDAYARALGLSKSREMTALLISNRGTILGRIGKHEEALAHYRRAAAEFAALELTGNLASSWMQIAIALEHLDRKVEALAFYDKAVALLGKLGDHGGEAFTLQGRGRCSMAMGRHAEAQRDLERSLELSRAAHNRPGEQLVLRTLGKLAARRGDWDESERLLAESLTMARATGLALDEAASLFHLARVSVARGRWAEAQQRVDEAVAINESLRAKVVSADLRSSYQDTTREQYELQVDVRMRRHRLEPEAGHAAAALHASELARARSFLELLHEARAELREDVDPALLKEERRLTRTLREDVQRHARTAVTEEAAAPRKGLDDGLAELRDLQARIRRASPRYASLVEPHIVGADEIRKALPADTVLLEYALGEERSYLWAVTRDGLDVFDLPERAALETDVRSLHRLLGARAQTPTGESPADRRIRLQRADRQLERIALRLSRALLAPAAALLEGRRMLVVPDGALHYLPFAVLPDPAGGTGAPRLIERHDVAYAPSASVAALLAGGSAAERPNGGVLVLADPVFGSDDARVSTTASARLRSGGSDLARLVYSRQEAQAIVSAAGARGRALLGFDARREVLLGEEPSRYRLLHFATHAVLDTRRPELSGLALSLVNADGRERDGWLRAMDLYRLRLPVDMVVLSGCQTALGKEVRSEGLVGLTRGFFHAGAQRVLSSLWKVDDRATAELMKELYGRLLASNHADPAAVLREAQRALIRSPRFRHPFYWGAFVLHGGWS
jgi:CHAT domain-containing protein/tetratricopeptide (TPR) repeat protein